MTARDLHTVTRDDAGDASTVATAAQRQRAYRLRRKRAAIEAIGQETAASRVTLLTLLAQDLAALEARTTPTAMNQALRSSARRILNTIVTRYGIEL
jgi:hypothetical protein